MKPALETTFPRIPVWDASFFIRRSLGAGHRAAMATAGMLVLAASVAFGQINSDAQAGALPPAKTRDSKAPAFAVVSIKQNKSGTGFFKSSNSPEGVSVENASLLMIIRGAYGMFNSLDDKFVGVPDWAKTEKYDIEAKVDPSDLEALHALDREQRQLMLQDLLVDRFKLKVHRETRELPIYTLVVAKSGAKIKQAKAGDTYENGLRDPHDGHTGPGVILGSKRGLAGQAISMSSLAIMLTQIVGRTVEDKTGLAGTYDFTLNWAPETAVDTSGQLPENAGPSIFTAIQEQLGLKLESTKGPSDVLVIDHVERPAPN